LARLARAGSARLGCYVWRFGHSSSQQRNGGPGLAYEVREVATSIAIRATPTTVWQQIDRAEPIRVEEQRFSWSQKIGFPRPIEATLSGEGVGAVRHAPRSWIHSDDCGEIAKR